MSAANSKPGRTRVLIADDDRSIRMVARQALEVAGFAVEEAGCGAEALTAAEKLRPDLVLLDVDMPDVDGFTVCSELRRRATTSDTPVLMMTGLNDSASIKRAYEVGGTDFVIKPPNWLILGHRVRHIVRASRINQQLSKSQAKLVRAQRMANVGWWEWDGVDEFTCSSEFCSILGQLRDDRLNSFEAYLQFVHEQDRDRMRSTTEQLLREGGSIDSEYRILRPAGEERTVKQYAEATVDDAGRSMGMVGTIQDITERKLYEDRIHHLAYYDGLTNLPNRRLFGQRLEATLQAAKRHGNLSAVLFLDLDRFKQVNDTMGHGIGDSLLREVAGRLSRCVRSSDCVARHSAPGADPMVARLGGDEFVILLSEIRHAEDAARVAQRVIELLSKPFQLVSQEIFVAMSIGIAVFPLDAKHADDLLKNADAAMYHAKEHGKSTFEFYTKSMNASAFQRFALENDLRRAVGRQELILHYQPVFSVGTGDPVWAEALLRWQHPDMGLLHPPKFISLAEETGMINQIGDWVLRESCRQCRMWHEAGHTDFRIAVNVSVRQFREPNFLASVREILEEIGLEPSYLELELTETTVMEDAEGSAQNLQALKELGVTLSIDDFGTGYSSLGHLGRFPLDVLKIDRSFLFGVPGNADRAALISAIIAMAEILKLDVVVEGVEREEQLAFLRGLGCSHVQGFLLGRPMPASEFEALLVAHAARDMAASAKT